MRGVSVALPQDVGRLHQRTNHRARRGLSRCRRRPAAFRKSFRAAGQSGAARANCSVLIKNGNSPPLPISAVRVERRPVYLVFLARRPGIYHLLTGNAQCDAPQYDLAALGHESERRGRFTDQSSAAIGQPGFSRAGSFARSRSNRRGARRFGLEIPQAREDFQARGAQQIELDLDVLAHAQAGLRGFARVATAAIRCLTSSSARPSAVRSRRRSRRRTTRKIRS